MRPRLSLSLPIALVALACSDSLTPDAVVGTYTLATIDGKKPPVVLAGAGGRGCVMLLVGGRLELRPGPDWSDLVVTRDEDCRAVDGGVTTDSLRYLGRYWLDGSTLTFQTELSLEDTLRFSGPVWMGGVTLAVRDTIRGLGEHRFAFF